MLFTTRTIVSAVSALAALAGSSLAQDSGPIINAPLTVYTCQPAAITFSGGTAPYYISGELPPSRPYVDRGPVVVLAAAGLGRACTARA